jgi:hypothetical protein
MKGIRNIVAAWDEVTANCMNSSWKKLWSEACHDFRGFEENEAAVTSNIVELANQLGMDEVDIDNVQELLQSHQTSLTNEELVQLEQQCYTEEDDSTDYDAPSRNLTTRVLTQDINMIMDVLDIFTENYADFDHSTAVKRVVVDVFSCFKELLREKFRAR